ncbi:MAG TPA: universal stress protein [Puia sp.]|nr:universal stress protein [Puia sp.]
MAPITIINPDDVDHYHCTDAGLISQLINTLKSNSKIMSVIKVLVPTDFSGNSKTGIRFALQWSSQQKIELIFVYVFHIIRIPQLTGEDFEKSISNEKKFYQDKLEQFVKKTVRSSNLSIPKYSCIALHGVSPDISIMDYCRQRGDISFICIGTRGAGRFKKLFGTHTGNLISNSPVPVIAIPKNYRRSVIKTLLYATDFAKPGIEIKKVLAFARPLHAGVKMLHVSWPGDAPISNELPEKKWLRRNKIDFSLMITPTNLTHPLHKDLELQMEFLKPSIMIMFTDQKRSLFKKIFFPSNAELLSFNTKTPLLTFKKEPS